MTQTTHPDKFEVRSYLRRRIEIDQVEPPPSPEDIKRELGWAVVKDSAEVERE